MRQKISFFSDIKLVIYLKHTNVTYQITLVGSSTLSSYFISMMAAFVSSQLKQSAIKRKIVHINSHFREECMRAAPPEYFICNHKIKRLINTLGADRYCQL